MGRTINLLDPITDIQANDDTRELPLCDPTSGISGSMTISQAKKTFGTSRLIYIGSISETTTITIGALAGMDIIFVARESAPLYPVSPGSVGSDTTVYSWDDTDLVIANPLASGERMQILYRNY